METSDILWYQASGDLDSGRCAPEMYDNMITNKETATEKHIQKYERLDWRTTQNFAHIAQEHLIWLTTRKWSEIQRRGYATSAFSYTYMDMQFANSNYQIHRNKAVEKINMMYLPVGCTILHITWYTVDICSFV